MEASEAAKTVEQINEYIQRKLWFDFDAFVLGGRNLLVRGGIDLTWADSHDVEIHFEQVFLISLPVEWMTDTSSPPLRLLTGEDAYRVGTRFQVEGGYHIFRFSPKDYPKDFGCFVAAETIRYEIVE